jgi:hypothetical protein
MLSTTAAAPRWGLYAQMYGAVIAAGFGYFLAGIPIQVSDSLGNLTSVHAAGWSELLRDQFWSRAYFRPLLLAQTKALLDLSGGQYFLAFRGFQVVQVFAAIWLFIRLLGVRSSGQCLAAMIAVSVLAGSHTFAGAIREAYPINNYMTVALCCLVALNVLAGERPRWHTDLLVVACFVLALGTIETGLIVWGCLFVGRLAGWRGVSLPALGVATLIVIAYFAMRFTVLNVGLPDLLERSSGYGFSRLDPKELNERFAASRHWFYLYNIGSSIATVLFSEPRAGVWMFVRELGSEEPQPWIWINVIASTAGTALVLWYAVTRRWWADPRTWSHGQRLVIVAAAVIAANAGISYPYTKDQIMSLGGMLFAAAVFAAVAWRLDEWPAAPFRRVATAALLVVVSAGGSWRVLGLQHNLVHTAFTQRNDWAYTDLWIASHPDEQRYPGNVQLVNSLYQDALRRRVPNLHLDPLPLERYFDHHTD